MGKYSWSFGGNAAPRFYVYLDDAASTLTSVRMDEPATVVDVQPVSATDSARSTSMTAYRSLFGHAFRVRVTFERFRDEDGGRERKLRAMINHLMRGGWVAFSHDHDRTWGSSIAAGPAASTISVTTTGNEFAAFSGSAAIGADDHVLLQSPNPYGKVEHCKVSTYTAGTGTLAFATGAAVQLDHENNTLIRWAGFFPRLVLDPDVAPEPDRMLFDEYRNTWTLDLPLMTQPDLEHAAISQG